MVEGGTLLIPELCQLVGLPEKPSFHLLREIAPFEEPDFSSKLIDLKRYFFDNFSTKLAANGLSEEV